MPYIFLHEGVRNGKLFPNLIKFFFVVVGKGYAGFYAGFHNKTRYRGHVPLATYRNTIYVVVVV